MSRLGGWFERLGTCAVLVLFALLAAWMLQITPERFTQQIAPDPGDPVLVMWLIDWVSAALPHGIEHTLQAPVFFPAQNSLLLADHWLGLGVLLAPLRAALGGNYPGPYTVYNSLLVLSFALGGAAMTWVCRRENCSWVASLLAGAVYTFAPARLGQLSHLQVLWAPTLPLILWTFGRLLREPSARRGCAFVLAFAGQLTGGSYLSYMVCVGLAAQLAEAARHREIRQLWWRRLPVLATTGVVAALLAGAFFAPYLIAESERGGRSSHEAAYFGASLASFVEPAEPSWYTRYVLPDFLVRAENQHFPGFLVTALLATYCVFRHREHGADRDRARSASLRERLRQPGGRPGLALMVVGIAYGEITTWRVGYGHGYSKLTSEYAFALLTAAFGAWLLRRALRRSPGPPPPAVADRPAIDRSLLWAGTACLALAYPIFFLPLRTLVPGLAELRVPARFFLVTMIPIAFFAARGIDEFRQRLAGRPGNRRLLTGGLLALAIIELPTAPIRWDFVPPIEARATDRWLRDAPIGALLELPLSVDSGQDLVSVWRQRLHGRRIVNGYSGYEPRFLAQLRQDLGGWGGSQQPYRIPDEVILERLASAGVTHLRFQSGMRLNRRGQVLLARLVNGGWLAPVGPDSDRERIFEIQVPPRPPLTPPALSAPEARVRTKRKTKSSANP